MNRTAVVSLLIVLALGSLPVRGASPATMEPMPEVLFTDNSGRREAVWVAAERVLTPSGEVDTNLFSDSEPETLERLMALPEKNGCIELAGIIYDFLNPPIRDNVYQAAKYASTVVMAEVTGLKAGFYGTDAGNLVQLLPVEILKGNSGEIRKPFYVFLPNGSFSVGAHRFCARNPNYPSLPDLGDQLMLFVPGRIDPSFPLLEILDEGGVVVLKKNSPVDLPARYQKDLTVKGLSSSHFVENVRSFVSRGNVK